MNMSNKPDNQEVIESENTKIGKSAEIDAIIISKLSERNRIELINPLDVSLQITSIIGNVASQLKKGKSPVAHLTPLFIGITLLSRMANVNAGIIIDSDNFKKAKKLAKDSKIDIQLVIQSMFELTNNAHEVKTNKNLNKSDFQELCDNATQNVFIALVAVRDIAEANKFNLQQVQSNAIKHINQLVKLF